MYLFRRRHHEDESEQVAYWRKANQIRKWFDDHVGVENCTEAPVTRDLLHELRDDCMQVLSNHDLAPILLPTQSGFFFGSTEYDEYYYDDLRDTVEQLGRILRDTVWADEEIYYYEWW